MFARPIVAPLAPGFTWSDTPLAVLLIRLDGTILAANAAAGRLGGLAPAALAGAPVTSLAPALGADWAALVDAVRREGGQTGAVRADGPAGRSLAFALSLAESAEHGAAIQMFAIDLGGRPAARGSAPAFSAGVAPVAPPPGAGAGGTGVRAPAPILARVRVLVVDDEPLVRTTVRRLLERRGATVVTAADGNEGEARVREEAFDLVVCDLAMPGRSGQEVLAAARACRPAMPFILMSGYTGRLHSEVGADEPDAILEKPFTARVLDAAIDDVLRRAAAL